MGVFTYETEFASVCAPARLYNALVLDVDNLIPRIAPQAVKTAEILKGDEGVRTIKKISFGEGSEYSYVKHKVDGIDKDHFVYNYSLIEGDVISYKIKKISYETKLMAFGSGSVIKSTSHYHTKGDIEISEEQGKEKAHDLFKLIENYKCNIVFDFNLKKWNNIRLLLYKEQWLIGILPPAKVGIKTHKNTCKSTRLS